MHENLRVTALFAPCWSRSGRRSARRRRSPAVSGRAADSWRRRTRTSAATTWRPCIFEDDDSQDLTAGQGLAVSLGGYFRPDRRARPSRSQASVGYKFSTTAASNADIGMQRTLLQLEALYRWPNGFYLGARRHAAHVSPKLNGDGFFPKTSTSTMPPGSTWRSAGAGSACTTPTSATRATSFEDVDASHVGAALHLALRPVGCAAGRARLSWGAVRSTRGTPCGRRSPRSSAGASSPSERNNMSAAWCAIS